MTSVNTVNFSQSLAKYLHEAAQGGSVINVSTEAGDVILMSKRDYEALLKQADMPELKTTDSSDRFYSEHNIKYLQSVISDIESGRESFVVKTIKELETMANE